MATNDSNGENQEKQDNAEDNFGLPDIEFKPLDEPKKAAGDEPTSESASETTRETSSYEPYSPDQDEPKSKAPVILGIVIVLVLAIASYLIYSFVIKPANEEKAKKELAAKQEAERKKAEEARVAKEKADEAERMRLEAIANAKPAVGTIEVLSARTKRYYVVVSSDVDDDLLMDYARTLSAKGISTKIVPPFGKKNFFRLTIADHDTWALAQTNADAAKAEYGGAVWVLKY